MDPISLSLLEISGLVSSRKISATELTQAYLQRIKELDPYLGCFLLVDEEGALSQAKALDEKLKNTNQAALPLCGVPVGVKDMIVTKGLETTAGSHMLKGFHPPYDATVVQKLKTAGAIIVGKMNLDEFAMGSSNENSAFFPCHNPWDPKRVPGGSSGGSAAAIAARLCALTLGTDTGGSIRQPAALCGVTGIKPTYGRVSRYGVIAFASSLDQVGPLTKSAEDAALALEVLGGYDPFDATSIKEPMTSLTQACKESVRGLRIGIPKEYFGQGLSAEIEKLVRQALSDLEKEGAKLVPISLPRTEYAIAVYYIIATAEASSNLARYDGIRYGFRATGKEAEHQLTSLYKETRAQGFGSEVKRRIMLGTYVLRSGYYDAYYKRASQVRTLLREDFLKAFESCDVIATPTSPVPAFRVGERIEDPLAMYLNDIYTISANLAGIPGISIPCGFTENLPVGLQFLGAPLGEASLFRAAAAYQRLHSFHQQAPSIETIKGQGILKKSQGHKQNLQIHGHSAEPNNNPFGEKEISL